MMKVHYFNAQHTPTLLLLRRTCQNELSRFNIHVDIPVEGRSSVSIDARTKAQCYTTMLPKRKGVSPEALHILIRSAILWGSKFTQFLKQQNSAQVEQVGIIGQQAIKWWTGNQTMSSLLLKSWLAINPAPTTQHKLVR